MQKVSTIRSKVIPLPLKDVDTDLIIPAQFLTSISKDGYGENLFRRLRDTDAEFPLNQAKFLGAQILVVDSNFGCGSSREHAVWALVGAGIKAVLSKSFADIFYSNSAKNGLLLVTLPSAQIDVILRDAVNGDYEVTIDLTQQTVTLPHNQILMFEYDQFRKYCLLDGLDDVDYILSHQEEIKRFRQKQESIAKFSTLVANN